MGLKNLFDRKGMYLYPWYISDITATKDIGSIAGVNVAKVVVTNEKAFETMYYDEESTKAVGMRLLEKVLTDKVFFEEVIQKIYSCAEDLLAFCRVTSVRELSKDSDEDVVEFYDTYTQKLRTLRTWGWVPVMMDGMIGSFLSEGLLERFEAHMESIGMRDKVAGYFSTMSSSEKESEVQVEELERLEIAKAIQTHQESETLLKSVEKRDVAALQKCADIYQKIEEHAKEFASLTYAYSGPPMDAAYAVNMLAEDFKAGDPQHTIDKIKSHYQTVIEEKKQIIAETKLPQDLQYAFRVASEFMYMKDWRKGAYQESYLRMDPVIDEIGKRLGISSKEVKYMTLDEARAALLEGKRDELAKKVKERLEHSCYVVEDGVVTVYEGTACRQIEKDLPKAVVGGGGDVNELKGLTAYTGVVRGVVKIVLTPEDMAKVHTGDILVSSSTNPDLILAMKKAGAFVTDLGGIVSHAAIVSREMKKPCIVGTGRATHVLKDGDEVEVDADHGIVRVLKRA